MADEKCVRDPRHDCFGLEVDKSVWAVLAAVIAFILARIGL